jgi:hypothetical protein
MAALFLSHQQNAGSSYCRIAQRMVTAVLMEASEE